MVVILFAAAPPLAKKALTALTIHEQTTSEKETVAAVWDDPGPFELP